MRAPSVDVEWQPILSVLAGLTVFILFVGGVWMWAGHMIDEGKEEDRKTRERYAQQCEDAGGKVVILSDKAHCMIGEKSVDWWWMD